MPGGCCANELEIGEARILLELAEGIDIDPLKPFRRDGNRKSEGVLREF